MSEEKTESPTEKKLHEARKQGSVSKSQDIADGVGLLAVVVVLTNTQPWITDNLHDIMREGLDFVAAPHHDDVALLAALWRMLRSALFMALPVLLAAALAALAALACQVGLHFTLDPIKPKFSNVNPTTGIKRVFSLRALLDLLKSVIKAVAFLWIGSLVLAWLLPLSLNSMYQPTRELAYLSWTACLTLLQLWLGVYVVVGIADYALQRMVFMRSQRMSKDEVKREHKSDEGDPVIKGERRKQQRWLSAGAEPAPQLAMRQASVLVTNPTHYAVALRYAPEEGGLPSVVASGQDKQAAVLRQLAREAGVPIVANPPLARALYRVASSHPIPEPLFEAVAAVLRWVHATEHLESAQPTPLPSPD